MLGLEPVAAAVDTAGGVATEAAQREH